MRGTVAGFKGHLAVFVASIAACAAFIIGLLYVGGYVGNGDSFRLRALLPTTSSVVKGSRVTMAGVTVGRVTGITSEGYATLISMQIDDDRVLPIPADTRVTLRQRTAIGENYVSLEKGRLPTAVKANAILPVRNADEYVDVDQVLSTLQGTTKKRAQQFIQSTGGALDTRGAELNMVLGRGSEIIQSAASIFTRLDRNRHQTAALIQQLGLVSAAIGERSEAIRVTADRGLVAMNALKARDDALADTLKVLPSTLAQVRSTSGTLAETSSDAAPVIANLARAMVDLRPAVAALPSASSKGRDLVAELGRSITPLTTTLRELRQTADPLAKAIDPLHRTVCQLNPMVRYLAPYAKDVVGFFTGFGSASNSYDSVSHVLRVPAVFGENSVVALPEGVSRAMFTLLRSGVFAKGMPLSWDPYPAPGQAQTNRAPETGGLFGRKELRDSGYTYPRIQADC